MNNRLTRAQAIQVLADHGWTPTSPTATLNGEWCADSTFDHEVGVRDWYTVEEIQNWLGY